MPKQKITREMVIEAAFDIARREGMEKVIVKNIADKLGCSVQPIYSYCSNMEGLKAALTERTGTFMKEYLAAHIKKIISGAWAGRSCVLPERSLSCFSCIFSDAAVTSIPCRICIPKKAAARLQNLYPIRCSLPWRRRNSCICI